MPRFFEYWAQGLVKTTALDIVVALLLQTERPEPLTESDRVQPLPF